MSENDVVRKVELNTLIATIFSTVTILCYIFVFGMKMKDVIVESIRTEFRAELRSQLDAAVSKQALRDQEQDFKIEELRTIVLRFRKDQ